MAAEVPVSDISVGIHNISPSRSDALSKDELTAERLCDRNYERKSASIQGDLRCDDRTYRYLPNSFRCGNCLHANAGRQQPQY